jgi:carbamoyl-phosphate synthase large subunit
MPKRLDLKKICILGAGPIVIGQACEFDYSGTQACKALKSEGYEVILINSNPATIMTDPETADISYIEPLTPECVEQILRKEKPCALLPTLGGQTALNLALDLYENGLLEELGIEMLGALPHSIKVAEDRQAFKDLMQEIGLEVAQSKVVRSQAEAQIALDQVGLPAILRPSYTLGGVGGGIVYHEDEFKEKIQWALDLSPVGEVLVEESLLGWKEFEMEVIRDQRDRVVVICAIENLDPMGTHTGDSITVAPAQTLIDREYQTMRNASIDVIRAVGVTTGGSNIQFALDPKKGRMVVIEMNPRVSRSSALASKATGFPIAKIAALLSIGYTLDELPNEITQTTTACFEPTLDYVITKIPRFAFEKFPQTSTQLNTQMKSIGEVMAIGSDFGSSLLKALRGLEWGTKSLLPTSDLSTMDVKELEETIRISSPLRLLAVAEGIRRGLSVSIIHTWSMIDLWFLYEIQTLVNTEAEIAQWRNQPSTSLPPFHLHRWKKMGFSDDTLAYLVGCSSLDIRQTRLDHQIKPAFKHVDTCAAEFEAYTPYLYSTYEQECEASLSKSDSTLGKVLIIGSGPNRIGQGIEFDYACVKAAQTVSVLGYESIMLNCNPETVSTDHDTSNRLFFEPIDLESVLDLVDLENPTGVIVQFGGQTPLRLAKALEDQGVPILGTSPSVIEEAEDRQAFSDFAKKLTLRLPQHRTAMTLKEAQHAASELTFPLLIRPSHVLGGRGMKITYTPEDFEQSIYSFFHTHLDSRALPLLIDVFLEGAIEVDVDAICDGEVALIGGVMEQVEHVGAHSGDSACWLPSYRLDQETVDALKEMSKRIALELGVVGLINIQYALGGPTHKEIYVIEVNPRASRTIPFVSKSIGHCLAHLATRVMIGSSLKELGYTQDWQVQGYFCKETVFPFSRFPGEAPQLRPEMRSTGEVMAQGASPIHAYQRAQIAASNAPKSTLGHSLYIDADQWGWHSILNQQHLAILPKDLHFYLCGTQETLDKIVASLDPERTYTLLDPQTSQLEETLAQIDVAFLLYRIPTSDYLNRYRSLLSAQIAYFTTAEALHAWWGSSWQEWDAVSLQKRLAQKA